MPSSLYRSTFSDTTIELSTTMPIAMTMASRDTRLNENPARLYRMGEAARETGMARLTESAVSGLPRKSRTMSETTRTEMTSSCQVLSMDARIGPVVSIPYSRRYPVGSTTEESALRTLSTTATELESVARWMETRTTGMPLMRA